MYAAKTYVDKANEHLYSFDKTVNCQRYYTHSPCYLEARKYLELCLVNGCKAILVAHNVPFNNASNEDIISYVVEKFPFGSSVDGIKTLERAWKTAVTSKNRGFYKQLDNRLSCELRDFIDFLYSNVK